MQRIRAQQWPIRAKQHGNSSGCATRTAQEPNLRRRQSKQKALETRCFVHNQERERAKKGYLNIKDDAHDGLEEASEDRVEAKGPPGRPEPRVHPRWL